MNPIFQPNCHKIDPVTNRVAVNLSPKESNDFHVLFRMVSGNYNLTPQELKNTSRSVNPWFLDTSRGESGYAWHR